MSWKFAFGLFIACVVSLFLWGGIYEFYKRWPTETVMLFGTGILWLVWTLVKELTHHEEAAEDPAEHRHQRRRAGNALDPWDPRLDG